MPVLLLKALINWHVMKDDKDNVQLSAVEDHDGILTIRGGGARRDWNGIHYKQGMSAKNVGTTKLSANIATIPPGGVAAAHIHVGFDLILYIIEGNVRHEFGPGLKQVVENQAGDFVAVESRKSGRRPARLRASTALCNCPRRMQTERPLVRQRRTGR